MITITLDPDQEALDALDAKVAARNEGLPEGATPYTRESHLKELLDGEISKLTSEKYAEALSRLSTAFKDEPYAKRLAVITSLEQQLS